MTMAVGLIIHGTQPSTSQSGLHKAGKVSSP